MLTSQDLNLIVRLRAALAAPQRHDLPALGVELDALLAHHTAHAASVAAARSKRGPAGRKGPQPQRYVVEIEPGWVEYAHGSKGVRAAVVAALATLGEPKIFVPGDTSFAAMLSKRGSWTRKVDTNNGTVTVTARKPTAYELKQLEESGTNPA